MELRKNTIKLAALAFVAAFGMGAVALNANVQTASAQTEEALFAMKEGASVRTVSPEGIRFATLVNEAYKTNLLATYPESEYTIVWGTTLRFTDTEENSYSQDWATKVWMEDGSGWNTALVEIPDSEYLTQITAESYVKVYANTDVEKTTVIYSDTVENAQTRSIAQTASWALNDGKTDEILYRYTAAIENASVTLDKEGYTYISKGEELLLTATATEGYGVAWKSSNENVAKVDKYGKVTAVGSGLATITASLGNASDSYQVGVDYTSIDFEDGQASPAFKNITAVQMTSGDLPTEPYTLSVGKVASSNAYGATGLDKVANASLTIAYDWLSMVFADKTVGSVTLDLYAAKEVAWVKHSGNAFMEYSSLGTVDGAAGVRIVYYRGIFNNLAEGTDEVLTVRQGNGLKFIYVDNVTVTKTPEVSSLILGFSKESSMKNMETLTYDRDVALSANYAYGTKNIKANSATMYIYLSCDYMKYLFDQYDVTSIKFDVILSVGGSKIQGPNNANEIIVSGTDKTGTELVVQEKDQESGEMKDVTYNTYIYTVEVTKERVDTLKTSYMRLRYTGGGSSYFFYADNLAVVTE